MLGERFFPIRGGGGLPGTTAAMKHDCFVNPDWGAPGVPGLKPFKAEMPGGRLFNGESDGSSFPNGGLRVTHRAAAFTTWDRGSPPFICESLQISHYDVVIAFLPPLS